MITPADIVQALIWTGHIGMDNDGGTTAVRKASQAWQTAKRRTVTESLPDNQAIELVSEGLKKRDAAGWAILRDDSVGFAVGMPTRLAKLSPPQAEGSVLWYHADGSVGQSVGVRYGGASCIALGTLYTSLQKKGNSYRTKSEEGFAIVSPSGNSQVLTRALCHPGGIIFTVTTVPNDRPELQRALFAATMAGTVINRTFNPSARPRPKLEELPAAPMEAADGQVARPRPTGTAPANLDTAGMTDRLKLVRRVAGDLSAEEIFEKAAGAVYMVKADKSIGSAVAVSESDLLTNCHVVGRQDPGAAGPRPAGAEGHGRVDEHQCRPLRAPGREQAAEMGRRPALQRHQGRRTRDHDRHTAGSGAHGRGRHRLVQAQPERFAS